MFESGAPGHLRYALRSLLRSPGFTAAAIFTLALGIGANTAVFSVADALLLRPLPYREPNRLVVIWDQLLKLGLDRFPAPFADYYDYRARNRVFEDIAAFTYAELDLSPASRQANPQHLEAMAVSANLFSVLGVNPSIGQTFTREQNEAGGAGAVLLSFALWKGRFGSDPAIVGQMVALNGRPYRIQGVMPRGFEFTLRNGAGPDIWIPLMMPRTVSRTQGMLHLIGRLKSGVSLDQVKTDLSGIAQHINTAFHPFNGPHGEDAGYGVRATELRDELFGAYRTGVLLLLGAVIAVLLIACANVGNLLLARGLRQEREFAIRAALGATRLRIVAELASSTVVLTLAGAALGTMLAFWATTVLAALGTLPQQAAIAIDFRVLAFTSVISLCTGLLLGLAPALKASRTKLETGPAMTVRRSPLRNALIAVEAALCVVLLIGAGLLVRSLRHLIQTDSGFNAKNVLSMRITLPDSRYPAQSARNSFFDRALEGIRRLPGVQSAAVVSALPLSGGGRGGSPFSIEGRPYNPSGRVPQIAVYYSASADYFKTMQIAMAAGRGLTDHDTEEAPRVAVVGETLARGFWPAGDAIGHRIVIGAPRPGAAWMTIVGVVKDVRNSDLRLDPIPQIYMPYTQNPNSSMLLVLRTATDPAALTLPAAREIAGIDAQQPVFDVKTMEQRLEASIGRDRFQAILLAIFALTALALAVIGIYGVVEHSVSQRIPEIGVRMAIGARRSDILRLVVIQGMAPAALGMSAGCVMAIGFNQFMRTLVFGISSTDAGTYVGVLVLFAAIALLACLAPAVRASRIDPITALRDE